MPPNDPNSTTRRVIDVEFAMPAQTMQVMQQIVEQMAAATAQIAAVASVTPEGRAEAAKHLASTTRPGQIPASSRGFASTGGADKQEKRSDGVSEGASVAGEAKPRVDWREQFGPRPNPNEDLLNQRSQMAQGNLEAPAKPRYTLQEARDAMQEQLAEQNAPTDWRQKSPEEVSGLSTGASDAGKLSLREKLHIAALKAHKVSEDVYEKTGVHIPVLSKIGKAMPGVAAAAAAEGTGEEETPDPSERHPVAHEAASLANQPLFQTFLLNKLMSARGEARQLEYQTATGGVQAGFDRPGQINIPGTDIGMINPFDALREGSAFREAINQRVNVMRLRLKGGINQEQAQAIVGNTAALGWTGEAGQNMAFDNISPLVQQGQNPAIVARMMDQAARNGQTPLAELRETLDNLGPSARAAHQSLDEYQQGLDEFANNLQSQGATYGQGVQTARDLTTAYGMTNPAMQALQNNPMTQAMAASQYGAMPWEAGALGTAGVADTIGAGVDMAMQAGAAFKNDPIMGPGGKVQVTGKRRQELFAAQALGVPPAVVHQYLMQREQAPHILKGTEALDNLRNKQKLVDAGGKHGAGAQFHEGTSKKGDWVDAREGQPGAVKKGGRWVQKATVGGEGGHYTFGAEDELGADMRGDWKTVTDEMVETARNEDDKGERGKLFKQIDKIKGMDDPHDRGKASRKFLSEAAKRVTEDAAEDSVKVQFTGAAAKYFEQLEKKGKLPKEFRDADKGGRPRSEASMADSNTDYVALLKAQYPGG